DPSSPAPSGEVRLRIPLPAYSLLPGTRVETSNIILLSNQVEPLAGSAIVEGSEEAPLLAVTCIVDKNLQDGAELKVEGLLKAGAFTVSFGVTSVVRQGIWGFVWIAMGAALLALLTPCVFPMIPITVSFFTKHSEHSKHPPVIPAAVYCLGIVLSFTLIGLIFSLAFKTNAASISQSPIVLGGIGVLFVVFSLSLFGMFELQLPAAFSNMVGSAQQKGGLLSIWLLGLLFAVTSFACTAPFVGTLLATSLSSGQWVRPMIGMAAFSAVLAVPFFFLALFPSKLRSLPRAGGWLTQVKVVMGFIELAAALKFLGDMDGVLSLGVFTRSFILSAWIVLFALTGVYLLGAFRMPHDSPREGTPVVALLLAIFFLSFAAYLFRGVGGDPLAPGVDVYLPKELHERSPIGRREALLKEIKSLGGMSSGGGETGRVGMSELFKNDYAGARAEAERLKVPIFIDFTGYS
ncbi:MAG TPA: cytochrome c biogenesis protein CcdA, partial [Planctomycetota bacterium]|nr:cytochrome c biogenesis protein CcdA [Planctomycetota bacterium]